MSFCVPGLQVLSQCNLHINLSLSTPAYEFQCIGAWSALNHKLSIGKHGSSEQALQPARTHTTVSTAARAVKQAPLQNSDRSLDTAGFAGCDSGIIRPDTAKR